MLKIIDKVGLFLKREVVYERTMVALMLLTVAMAICFIVDLAF
jgi:hypothetical protein